MSARLFPLFPKQAAAPFLLFTLVCLADISISVSMSMQNATVQIDTSSIQDRVALLAIKLKIRDDPQGVLSSWNDSLHFCQWQGVTCSSRHQRVTVLDLSSRGLAGSLSPWVGNLSFLREIWVQNNSFSGEIPAEVGHLSRLEVFRLFNNSFEGNIPTNLSLCSNLKVLHLGSNKLLGKIPSELGSLTKLNLLILHSNNLTGGIPPFVGNLTSLDTLSLGDCPLGGRIKDVFHRLKNLRRLALVGNELFGTIPPSLYNLSLLEQVFLDDNQLHGTLPTNIGFMLPRIQVFTLPDNQFTGPLPPSIFNSSDFRSIDVARNNFSGKVAINSAEFCKFTILSLSSNSFGSGDDDEMKFIDALSNCSILEALDIGDNYFRGYLPDSIGNLSTKLYFLSLASNYISGSVSPSIGNLSGLTYLDLSSNQFSGTIPINIGKLPNLQKLDLKGNNFSGNIPSSIGNLSLLLELHMGSNKLSDTIPSSIGNCTKLIVLTLCNNHLSGVIPRELFGLSSLSVRLNLGSNYLSGQLPQEVGQLRNLNELVLAGNRLSGELPSSLGSCSSLQILDISNNLFQGFLPFSLSYLKALQNLNLSQNSFTGQIPSYLESIPLENLNLSFNRFEGEVTINGVFANASAISIFGNNKLCGGIPELRLPKCTTKNSKGNSKLSLAVLLVLSLVPVLFFAAIIVFLVCYWRRKKEENNPSKSTFESSGPSVKVSYGRLYKATEGFSPKNLIGEGSFASVYKGDLGTDGVVAVKVLNLLHPGSVKSFISECKTLKNARHRNLVKVITCCSSADFQGNEFKAIVYKFMPNGTLDTWLHSCHRTESLQDELRRPSLLQRVSIALDVAYALNYLHHRCGKTIVHCDLKPSNILLDDDMVAHVGDFGLSKILRSELMNRYHSSSIGIRGTVGYTAPEYGLGSKMSVSGDIYSYGILLLEMMTNKRPTDPMFGDGLNLHSYASTSLADDRVLEIIDPILLTDDDEKFTPTIEVDEGTKLPINCMTKEVCLKFILGIGVACSVESPQCRLDTTSVIDKLQLVKDAILGTSTA